MKLFIHNKTILATGDFIENETEFVYPNLIIPKIVVDGYLIIEDELPADYINGKYLYDNGFVLNPDWALPESTIESTNP